ncbi:sortase domain-containing protein [Pleionea sediminis]|uniref:sortase domain-containing protein n=1 Tax=Pleionea sediminis TaxID=2569479 RepID=UPI001185A486|nr:sortase [Pleionea sediminis]
MRNLALFFGSLLILVALIGLVQPIYYLAKGALSQVLLQQAWEETVLSWQETLAGSNQPQLKISEALSSKRYEKDFDTLSLNKQKGSQVKPWPWADTWPVFKMTVLRKSFSDFRQHYPEYLALESWIVLADASGESLAFGPGLVTPNFLPGQQGNSLIAAHRDSHFRNLDTLRINDRIRIEMRDGNVWNFDIDDIRVVDAVSRPDVDTNEYRISLITCYPFDMAVQNPSQRLIVSGKLSIW